MMTIADLHNVVEATDLWHALFCIEQEESEYGRDAMRLVRNEWNRLCGADYDTQVNELHSLVE